MWRGCLTGTSSRPILNCEGTCKLKSCELDPALAERVNVESVRNLLEQIRGTTTRLVHMSVDLVFSGTAGGGHVEDDPPDPVTVYGKTMLEAEQLIVRERPQACVLRISLPMGISFSGHAGAIDWIQSRFRKSKPATLFFDEIRTPKYTDCLNLLCEAVLANDLGGLYHAGGPRRLSLFEIAQVVNRVGGYDARHLIGCYRHEVGPIPPRAGDVTMDSSKLVAALGYDPFDPWPIDDRWVPTHRDWHRERPPGEAGSPELLARDSVSKPGPPRPAVVASGLIALRAALVYVDEDGAAMNSCRRPLVEQTCGARRCVADPDVRRVAMGVDGE